MQLQQYKTTLMGILNVTPDSFFDGGKHFDKLEYTIAQVKQMVIDGADIIDIGGESSRPGAEPVSIEEELRRVIPIIEALAKEITAPISIDTYKPQVAKTALQAGAKMLNDITGFKNPDMIAVAAEFQVPVVVMHMQGEPKSMQENPTYTNVIEDIKNFFVERIQALKAAGVKDIILDPGIGFGKTLEHNLNILKHLEEFTTLGCPILVGPSRKSFIGKITGLPVEERLEGTLGAVAVSVMNGASIVRVHDVKACRRVLDIVDAIKTVK